MTGPQARKVQTAEPAAPRRASAPLGAAPRPAPDPRLDALAANRVVIEAVSPEIEGGRFPAKAAVGDSFEVEADIFSDGHDKIDAALLIRRADAESWREVPMALVDNDRWRGVTIVEANARYLYTLIAWRDLFASWRDEVSKKHAAGVPVALELKEGMELVARALKESDRVGGADRSALAALLAHCESSVEDGERLASLLSREAGELMRRAGIRTNLSRYPRELELIVDRKRAAFSAWYELMPRSMSDDPRRHGTFDDVIRKLPYVRDLGFDVLYFPPIHPIGGTHRKGKNNSLAAGPDDPGSPYAIGSEEGGHDAIHPKLGTFEDFARLIAAAREHGLEIALDFAIQCSPDHPWIKE
ncbi:MAG: maltotransferase domain-containing protein, partial [Propylenella sp.]